MSRAAKSYLSHLECPECGKIFVADQLQTYCLDCRSPLFARYDLPAMRSSLKKITLRRRSRGRWRWAELLPVRDPAKRLTLGEGATPLLFTPSLATQIGLSNLWVKNEALNPTSTFKARGLGVAVAHAMELGVRALVIPTAGNAGGALAVNDDEILSARLELAMQEGIQPAPKGAATLAGQKHLVKQDWPRPEEKIVSLNTGSGLKFV